MHYSITGLKNIFRYTEDCLLVGVRLSVMADVYVVLL